MRDLKIVHIATFYEEKEGMIIKTIRNRVSFLYGTNDRSEIDEGNNDDIDYNYGSDVEEEDSEAYEEYIIMKALEVDNIRIYPKDSNGNTRFKKRQFRKAKVRDTLYKFDDEDEYSGLPWEMTIQLDDGELLIIQFSAN